MHSTQNWFGMLKGRERNQKGKRNGKGKKAKQNKAMVLRKKWISTNL